MPSSAEPTKVCPGTACDTITLDQKTEMRELSWEMVPMTAPKRLGEVA
jgi:hypothetical protein